MHRTEGAGHVGNMFVAENEALLRPPTEITPDVLNTWQEEMANVATMNGAALLTAATDTNTQMREGIIGYVQSVVNNGATVMIVRAASTAAINLAAPGAAIDGANMNAGEAFLEKDNATGAARGIYIWNGPAVPATRPTWADAATELKPGTLIVVTEGTTNADTIWELTTDAPVVIGTSALTFARKDTQAVFRKNGFINGRQWIDQKNSGAAVNLTNTRQLVTDLWFFVCSAAPSGTLTAQQVAGDGSTQKCVRVARSAGSYTNNIVQAIQTLESKECYGYAGKTVPFSFRARAGSANLANGMVPTFITGTGTDQGTSAALAGTWTGTATTNPSISPAYSAISTIFQTFRGLVSIPAGTTEICFYINNNGYTGSGSANDYIEFTDFKFGISDLTSIEDESYFWEDMGRIDPQFQIKSFTGPQALPVGTVTSATSGNFVLDFKPMRAIPSVTLPTSGQIELANSSGTFASAAGSIAAAQISKSNIEVAVFGSASLTAGNSCRVRAANAVTATFIMDATI